MMKMMTLEEQMKSGYDELFRVYCDFKTLDAEWQQELAKEKIDYCACSDFQQERNIMSFTFTNLMIMYRRIFGIEVMSFEECKLYEHLENDYNDLKSKGIDIYEYTHKNTL